MQPLEDYIKLLPKVKLIRLKKRSGMPSSQLSSLIPNNHLKV
jgi:hypothetical protein